MAEYEVTVDNELVTYVSDGDTLNVQAKIGAAEKNTASFAGFFTLIWTMREIRKLNF